MRPAGNNAGSSRTINGLGRRYVNLLCMFFLFVCSCSDKRNMAPATTPALDTARMKAVAMANAGQLTEAMRFLDSTFHNHPNANIADKYEYYFFYYDRNNRAGRFGPAENYIDSMFWLIESTDNVSAMPTRYAKANLFKADRLFEEEDYAKAYEYYYRAKVHSERSPDSCAIGYYYYKMGLVLYRGRKYDESISPFKLAINNFTHCGGDLNYFFRTQEIYDNIALAYQQQKQYDSALIYYNKALDFLSSGREPYAKGRENIFDMSVAVIQGNMGTSYMALGEYDKAENLFRQSIAVNDRPGYDSIDVRYTRIKLANLYMEQGRTDMAISVIREVQAAQERYEDRRVSLRLYDLLHKYYAKLHDNKRSFEYLLKYNSLRDSMDISGKKVTGIDINERVSSLTNAGVIAGLQEKDRMRTTYLLITGIVAFLLFTIVILVVQNWSKYRNHVGTLTKLNHRLTEQKNNSIAALHKLERADKEKDRILKAVSHDMRSPVNSAMALTDLLLAEEDKLTEEQKEYLNLIRSTCGTALNRIKDLLEIATAGRGKLTTATYDIRTLVNDTITKYSAKAAGKNQTINLNLPQAPVIAEVNAEKFSRVISALLSNAIKFSANGGTIDISLREEQEGFTIIVKDYGVGIPEALKDKIFDIFTEAKRFGTAGEEPYGVGLFIARQITEAHGGEIRVDSKYGKGSTFYVRLG